MGLVGSKQCWQDLGGDTLASFSYYLQNSLLGELSYWNNLWQRLLLPTALAIQNSQSQTKPLQFYHWSCIIKKRRRRVACCIQLDASISANLALLPFSIGVIRRWTAGGSISAAHSFAGEINISSPELLTQDWTTPLKTWCLTPALVRSNILNPTVVDLHFVWFCLCFFKTLLYYFLFGSNFKRLCFKGRYNLDGWAKEIESRVCTTSNQAFLFYDSRQNSEH